MISLPDRIQKSTERAEQAVSKLKALQALQPEWTRLQRLRSAVLKTIEAKAKELEVQVAGKAHAAAELHDQKHELESILQVWPCDKLSMQRKQDFPSSDMIFLKHDLSQICNHYENCMEVENAKIQETQTTCCGAQLMRMLANQFI